MSPSHSPTPGKRLTGETALAAAIGRALRELGWTIATAESCTAGLVAARLTSLAGSSEYFLGGFITYADAAKKALLQVPAAILRTHGAVSEATAERMALGARARLGADVAVAVTGIAGPGGATPDKPVGLVYVAVATERVVVVSRHLLGGSRAQVRAAAVEAALEAVRASLAGLATDGDARPARAATSAPADAQRPPER